MISCNCLSPSLENYLEVILNLTELHGAVRVTDLSEELSVAKSSVNQAVSKLVELKLVYHERYGPLKLTTSGLELANKIKRRHKILKKFMTEILGVERDIAEEDACKIEHHISSETFERLVDFLASQVEKGESANKTQD